MGLLGVPLHAGHQHSAPVESAPATPCMAAQQAPHIVAPTPAPPAPVRKPRLVERSITPCRSRSAQALTISKYSSTNSLGWRQESVLCPWLLASCDSHLGEHYQLGHSGKHRAFCISVPPQAATPHKERGGWMSGVWARWVGVKRGVVVDAGWWPGGRQEK